MKNILEANTNIMKILGKPHIAQNDVSLSRYCVQAPVDEGRLLFHTLTRELLLLSEEEAGQLLESDVLKDHWFVVPDSLDEKKCADTVKWVQRTTAKQPKHITSYTILTTTDCNARCFYCYETGRSRIPMTEETAHKTARYIKEYCGGEHVKLSWFGGEPLFNKDIIDVICEDLRKDGVEYSSVMTSNGYLFDENTIEKAGSFWNLKRVQITLDGTEEVYNRSKAYIYRDGKSPYQVVLSGIGRLLDAGISVVIRMNMDLYNAENLLALVDELAERFTGKKGLFVYAHPLFDTELSMAELHTEEEWQPRYEALYRLNSKLVQYGLSRNQRIKKNLKLNYCMADSGSAVVIAPTGDIGLCEHYSGSEFVGHIDREGFDKKAQLSWKETSPEILECTDCFFYPECLRLKKCAAGNTCFRQARELTFRSVRQSMLHEYQLWNQNRQNEEDEVDQLEAFSMRLAGKVFKVQALFSETKAFCGEYLCNDDADFSIDITQEDIAREREKAVRQDSKEFGKALQHSASYLETLALYRKIAGRLAEHQTLLVHGSAIAVDGQGYLFTAKSGTGKSTHTRLWRELLGERAVMINDDKPLITINENGVSIHGTPWCGKHGLHTNLSVPLRAICILERGEKDAIEPVNRDAAMPVLLQQTYRPEDMVQLGQVLTAVGMLAQSVKLYRLHCTMNPEAAQVAYAAMALD